MLHLVFMGKLRDLAPAGLSAAEPPAAVKTLADVRDWVMVQAPALAAGPFKLIHNHAVAHDLSIPFQAGDEIAFLPPMSGG